MAGDNKGGVRVGISFLLSSLHRLHRSYYIPLHHIQPLSPSQLLAVLHVDCSRIAS